MGVLLRGVEMMAIYGNYLVIESLDGLYKIKYSHLTSIAIFDNEGNFDLTEGLEFKRGQRIAKMGNTGKCYSSTPSGDGSHLDCQYYERTTDGWRLLNASAIIHYIGE